MDPSVGLVAQNEEARIAKRLRVCGKRRLCKPTCKIVLLHRPPNRNRFPPPLPKVNARPAGICKGHWPYAPISFMSG